MFMFPSSFWGMVTPCIYWHIFTQLYLKYCHAQFAVTSLRREHNFLALFPEQPLFKFGEAEASYNTISELLSN